MAGTSFLYLLFFALSQLCPYNSHSKNGLTTFPIKFSFVRNHLQIFSNLKIRMLHWFEHHLLRNECNLNFHSQSNHGSSSTKHSHLPFFLYLFGNFSLASLMKTTTNGTNKLYAYSVFFFYTIEMKFLLGIPMIYFLLKWKHRIF